MKADGGAILLYTYGRVKLINSNIIKCKKELKKKRKRKRKMMWKIVELAKASVLYTIYRCENLKVANLLRIDFFLLRLRVLNLLTVWNYCCIRMGWWASSLYNLYMIS